MSDSGQRYWRMISICRYCLRSSEIEGRDDLAARTARYPACSIGEQSPIDLTGAVRAEIEPPTVSWQPQAFSVVNNGHTIQANASPGGFAVSAGRKYELQQFHSHTPTEHTLDGKRSVREAHFVHAGENRNLMVIGVFLEAGGHDANPAFSALNTFHSTTSEHGGVVSEPS
jgi:carbonic anhydrase